MCTTQFRRKIKRLEEGYFKSWDSTFLGLVGKVSVLGQVHHEYFGHRW